MNTATTAEEKAAVCAPMTPAANDRQFRVTIKREGITREYTWWAASWFDAWVDALDAHGHGVKIEVAPC
jgi:hypothetical protein